MIVEDGFYFSCTKIVLFYLNSKVYFFEDL